MGGIRRKKLRQSQGGTGFFASSSLLRFFSCIPQNYCPKIAQRTVACTLPQQTSLSSREDSKESIMIWGKRRSRIRIL